MVTTERLHGHFSVRSVASHQNSAPCDRRAAHTARTLPTCWPTQNETSEAQRRTRCDSARMVESQRANSNLIKMNPILPSAAGNPDNQDRGSVVSDGPRTLLSVADGAGGLSGGAEAAVMATDFFRQNSAPLANCEDCTELRRGLAAKPLPHRAPSPAQAIGARL